MSGLGLGIGYIPHLTCLLAVNIPVRNVLGKGSQALAFLLCQKKCEAVLKVHGSCLSKPFLAHFY